jgi:hypothetical protein
MGGHEQGRPAGKYEDYLTLSNPDLAYFPRNITDSILARQRQIKDFSSRYESMPWVARLPAADRKEFEAGFRNVLEFTRRFAAAGGKIHAGTDTVTGGTPGLSQHHEMDRRYLGQDDLPRPAAFGVRSPGERDCARHTQPLQRARARAGRRDYRGPRRCGACLQPASGGRNLEHGSPIGTAKASVPAPLPGPERRDPATSIPSIAARCEPSRYSTAP